MCGKVFQWLWKKCVTNREQNHFGHVTCFTEWQKSGEPLHREEGRLYIYPCLHWDLCYSPHRRGCYQVQVYNQQKSRAVLLTGWFLSVMVWTLTFVFDRWLACVCKYCKHSKLFKLMTYLDQCNKYTDYIYHALRFVFINEKWNIIIFQTCVDQTSINTGWQSFKPFSTVFTIVDKLLI